MTHTLNKYYLEAQKIEININLFKLLLNPTFNQSLYIQIIKIN